jgi:hypothetical protein
LSARALSRGSSHTRQRRREHEPDRDSPHGDRPRRRPRASSATPNEQPSTVRSMIYGPVRTVYGAAAFGFDPSGASLAFIAPKAATAQAVRLSLGRILDPGTGTVQTLLDAAEIAFFWRRTARRSQCSRSTCPAGAASRQRTRSWPRARHPPPPTRASVSTSDSWRWRAARSGRNDRSCCRTSSSLSCCRSSASTR